MRQDSGKQPNGILTKAGSLHESKTRLKLALGSLNMASFRLTIVKLLQQTKLNKVAHKIYYNYIHGFNTATKEVVPALEIAFQKSMELGIVSDGDYYEFGLFKGYAFWQAQKIANTHGLKNMRFFGFDSFKGLPKVQGEDKTKAEVFYEGQYACSKDQVTKNLSTKGVDWSKTLLIEGFFEDSLNEQAKEKYQMGKVAIALIDCDLYSSTSEVLRFIKNLITSNTILIFDDWNCFDRDDEKGQRKAFREFLETNKQFAAEELFEYGIYGQAFLLDKR